MALFKEKIRKNCHEIIYFLYFVLNVTNEYYLWDIKYSLVALKTKRKKYMSFSIVHQLFNLLSLVLYVFYLFAKLKTWFSLAQNLMNLRWTCFRTESIQSWSHYNLTCYDLTRTDRFATSIFGCTEDELFTCLPYLINYFIVSSQN